MQIFCLLDAYKDDLAVCGIVRGLSEFFQLCACRTPATNKAVT